MSRAWYYLEPWVILPPQRPMPWQGLAIIIGVIVALFLAGDIASLIIQAVRRR